MYQQLPDRSFQNKGESELDRKTGKDKGLILYELLPDKRMETYRRFIDIDGDGEDEYVLSRTTVSILAPKTEIWIFKQEDELDPLKAKPRWHSMMKGISCEHTFMGEWAPLTLTDFDSDGDLDLMLLTLDFQGASARSHIKAFLRRGIEGNLECFLWEKDKGYPSGPDFRLPVKIDYNGFMTEWDTLMKVIYDLDFSLDGNPDLCITQGQQRILVYRFLSPEKGFQPEPMIDLKTPDTIVSLRALDLNNDGIPDFLVRTFDTGLKRYQWQIYLSTR